MTGKPLAVVTGGAQGIGYGIASHLLDTDADVAILDINGDAAHTAADRLGGKGTVMGFQCDVGDRQQIDSALMAVRESLGIPTMLISNAGWSPYQPFVQMSDDDVDRVVAINYTGPLALCRTVLPGMIEQEFGRIVFIGSDAGRVGTRNEAVYAGAKAALLGFAKSLAVEVSRHGITVNVVSPGSTDTPLLRAMVGDDGVEKRIRANPMKRLATPQDLASAVGFFCGQSSSYITGQILSVNGGMSRLG